MDYIAGFQKLNKYGKMGKALHKANTELLWLEGTKSKLIER